MVLRFETDPRVNELSWRKEFKIFKTIFWDYLKSWDDLGCEPACRLSDEEVVIFNPDRDCNLCIKRYYDQKMEQIEKDAFEGKLKIHF